MAARRTALSDDRWYLQHGPIDIVLRADGEPTALALAHEAAWQRFRTLLDELVADPVQLWTGTHRRRLMRLLARLDRQQGAAGLEREHVLARLGDLGDAVSSLWRWLR